MALIPRFALFALLLLPYQCEAKAENCSETQCLLLPVGDDLVASKFHFKASEKGVRLVYINLTIVSNASCDPLEKQDVFLPHRWIWANTVDEQMLTLHEDYDILSAGLLNYQVRRMDVKLKDQPSGCLAKLNSTCQNLAVGRMLLENVTSSSSGDILHQKRPVVCVAVINTTSTDDSKEHDMWYHCCDMHEEARTGRAAICCDHVIYFSKWVKIVYRIFSLLSFYLALFAPALPLALPDYVFSLEDEVEKENRRAEQINRETTGYQVIINDTEGEQDNQSGTEADRSDADDVPLLSTTSPEVEVVTVSSSFAATTTTANNIDNNNINNGDDNDNNDDNNINNTIQEETGQNTSNCVGNSREREKRGEFIPVDDSSPINLSTLLRECFQRFPDIPLSFNIKLAVICLCVYPCVLYVQIGLYHTLKKTSIDEIIKKHVLVGNVFSSGILFVNVTVNFGELLFLVATIALILTIFMLVVFLRPMDFFLEVNETCPLCRRTSQKCSSLNLSLASRRSLGHEIQNHLKILHHYVWYFTLRFGNILVSICDNLLLGRLREEMHPESRVRHLLCVCLRFISFIVALPFVVVGGILSLLILILVFIALTSLLSPIPTLGYFSVIKISHRFSVEDKTTILALIVSFVCLIYTYVSLTLLRSSCLFISFALTYIIIGLGLNGIIITPYLVFILVLTTNVYLCYAKMQSKYKEVKKMISERLQELHMNSNVPKGTIRAEIYWFVCDKVLPIKSEICRMLRNMVLVIAFLFLALYSIVFFGNEYDISTLTTTISVFFTGSIPALLLKALTKDNSIIGWAKIKMEREIKTAVREYRGSRNGEAAGHQIADTRV